MKYTGKIIVLAFPDTFVKMSDELMCKLLPLLGLGTRTHIKAGHAAMVLIENKTGKPQYFDFGRYVTPEGKGRVRSARTDVELEIPFLAAIEDDGLKNLDQFLVWLDAHPEKTHGSGRLIAAVCEHIDYDLALRYVENLQDKGSVPYKAFGAVGSNCARFVTETILAATDDTKIIKSLKHNKKFTPSTVGNVEKCACGEVYEVLGGVISPYTSTALKENLTNYFDKRVPDLDLEEVDGDGVSDGAQLLSGTGSSAWFRLEEVGAMLMVTRFTEQGILDFQGMTAIPDGFAFAKAYKFIYDCNCAYCTIEQDGISYRLELTPKEMISSSQRVHSA